MKKRGWIITGIIVVLVAIVGGVLWWQHQQAAQGQAERVAAQLARNNKVAKQIASKWTDDQHNYVKSSVTADTLQQLSTAQQAAAKQATAKAERQATANELALTKLKRAYTATAKVNALFEAPALVDAKVSAQPLIKSSTTTQAINQAAASGVNATLSKTLAQLQTLAKAQVSERTALKAAVDKIADNGTLKDDVSRADLAAFQAVVAGLKYPQLAAGYHNLVTAVAAKIKVLDSLKSMDPKELDRRILYLMSGAEGQQPDMKKMQSSWVQNGQFAGDTYQADIYARLITDSIKSQLYADVKVQPDGKLIVHEHQSGATKTYGNVLENVPADLAAQRPDPNGPIIPKIKDFATFKALLEKAGADVDADAKEYGDRDYIGLANSDDSGYYYEKHEGGIYTCTFEEPYEDFPLGPTPTDAQFDAQLTLTIWNEIEGN
ncbi:hypothetical protein ACFQ5J_03310 [Lacticaseibacillus baoqingensis]|uniref:Uncharacterized protein n=1 Tax=Lacticaseibacillus baoqingensis TaxID=2486013 RepID=A0ABW4E576_9LACO|nr:hypothetical protein [Lacticaseibacillus baoqingensis]